MAFEEHYDRFTAYRDLGQSEVAEKHLSLALREVFTLKNQSFSVQCLWDLGKLYTVYGEEKQNGDCFTKAVALFNAALRRLDMISDSQGTQKKIWNSIKDTEKTFVSTLISECSRGCINEQEIDILHREMLDDIRKKINERLKQIDESSGSNCPKFNDTLCREEERIKTETNRIKKISSLSCFITDEIKEFLKTLISECIDYLGKPPSKFSFLGLGSMAKNEMTPYSDLEFAILTGDNTPQIKQYFRILTDMLHIKILNLGETVLPSMYIKSLNDFESPNPSDNWFYDHVTPKGLSLDGAMPWACKTAKGRLATDFKPWVTELMQTPPDMASFQTRDSVIKEGYKMADVLRSVCLIEGCEVLMTEYLQQVDDILSQKCHQPDPLLPAGEHAHSHVRAMISLREDFEKYDISPDLFTGGALHNVKGQLYRFSSSIIQSLGLYFGVKSPQTLEIICGLFDVGIISKENKHELSVMSTISYEMRVRTYIKQLRQKENASVLPPLVYDVDKYYDVFFAENDDLIFRFYQTAIPLGEGLRQILSGRVSIRDGFKTASYFDGSWHSKGIIYYRLLKKEKARVCFQNAVDQNPTNIESHIWLAMTLHSQNYFQESLACSRKALGLFHKSNAHFKHMNTLYHTMGLSLAYIGPETRDEALVCLHKAMQIQSDKLGVHLDLINVPTLITIGYVHSKKREFTTSREFQLRALKAEKEKGDISCSVNASIIYNNMGTDSYNQKNYQEAAEYHERSLAIRKRIFGNVCHPLIAVNVNGLWRTYAFLEKFRRALPLLKEYKRMAFIDVAQSKPDITGLCIAGVVVMKHSFDNTSAMEMFEEALHICKESNAENHVQAVLFNNIGFASYNLGQFEKAQRYYEKALMGIEKVSPDVEHADIYDYKAGFSHNLGVLFLAQGKHEESLTLLQLAYRIRTELNSTKIVSVTESYIALLYHYMKTQPIGQCVDICEKAKANHWAAYGDQLTVDHIIVLNNLGKLYSQAESFDMAIACHEEAVSICQDIYDTELHGDLADSCYLLGKSWRDIGDLDRASSCLKRALSILKKIFGDASEHVSIVKTKAALTSLTEASAAV